MKCITEEGDTEYETGRSGEDLGQQRSVEPEGGGGLSRCRGVERARALNSHVITCEVEFSVSIHRWLERGPWSAPRCVRNRQGEETWLRMPGGHSESKGLRKSPLLG